MAESNLKTFVTEIADSIRSVKGTTGKISPKNFKTEIEGLKVSLENDKVVVPTESQQIIKPSDDYDALAQITVEAIPEEYIIPEGQLEVKENGIYDITNKQSVKVAVTDTSIEEYQGSYEVTPSTSETSQTLSTKNKTLLDNVIIKPIPYFQVDNNKGTTVFIGNEVETNGL